MKSEFSVGYLASRRAPIILGWIVGAVLAIGVIAVTVCFFATELGYYLYPNIDFSNAKAGAIILSVLAVLITLGAIAAIVMLIREFEGYKAVGIAFFVLLIAGCIIVFGMLSIVACESYTDDPEDALVLDRGASELLYSRVDSELLDREGATVSEYEYNYRTEIFDYAQLSLKMTLTLDENGFEEYRQTLFDKGAIKANTEPSVVGGTVYTVGFPSGLSDGSITVELVPESREVRIVVFVEKQ